MTRSRAAASVSPAADGRQRWLLISAVPGAVLECHGGQQDRHCRRRGHRQGNSIARQIRADGVEEESIEPEATPRRQVRRVHEDLWAVPLRQIGECRPVEQMLVVVLRRELAPVEVERRETNPVAGSEELQGQVSLHRALQEACLEVPKDAIAVQSVVGGREAPTGHGGDQVDLVEERPRSPPRTAGVAASSSRTPYAKAAALVPPPENARIEQQLIRARPDGVALARAGPLRLP